MYEFLKVSFQKEDNGESWYQVQLGENGHLCNFEVLSPTESKDSILPELLMLIPHLINLRSIQLKMSSGKKVDMGDWTIAHSKINQFICKFKFRNVKPDDFLAQSAMLDNRKKLGLPS